MIGRQRFKPNDVLKHNGLVFLKLTLNKWSIIDEVDYIAIKNYRWYAVKDRNKFYAKTTLPNPRKRITLKLHRLLLPNAICVDHKNGSGLDTRRLNIREASRSNNSHNRSQAINNTIGYKGVYKDKDTPKWKAAIGFNGKLKHIGVFNTPQEAAYAYNCAATLLHGAFAKLNNI